MEIAVHNTGAKKYATANHTGFCCREYYPVADRLIKRIFLTGLCSFWVKARYREAWMSTR